MACSLSLAPLCQPPTQAGQEHGRTIPLADLEPQPEVADDLFRKANLSR